MRPALRQILRNSRVHIGVWAAIAVLAGGLSFVLLGGLASTDSSLTVTQGDFELTCPTGTVAENATLACTLKNTAAEAKPWPVVAILHLSTDDDRALVRGTSIDVTLGTPNPSASIDGGVTWIGDTLVGYSRFDWSGTASAEGAAGSSRTVNIMAGHDSLDEDSEKFYVALGPDASKGVGLLYNNKASVALTDDDGPSTDTSLSSLAMFAGHSRTLSPTQATQSQTVAYEVTEATLTAASARGTAMAMSASFNGSSLDLDGRGGTSIEVISEQESAAVPLAVGTTTVTLTVTAEDGSTTGTHTVSIVRSALGESVDTVAVSVPSFTLTCPAEVDKATDAQCTLRASGSAGWPVVAVIHSSADGVARALVAEDPIIPDTDPAYSKDVSLGNQQPARTAFNRGYGELFSGGSHTLYRTYGYEKFDWTGTASAGATRTVTIQIHDSDASSDVEAEIFYVALAPSDYTGLSQLVDNKVPIILKLPQKAEPMAESVEAQNVVTGSAEMVVEVDNPSGTLYLRYRAGASGPWTETQTQEAVTSSPARLSLTSLTAGTQYQVQASFDEDFSTGMVSGSFTTPLRPSVIAVQVVSDAGDCAVYALGETILVGVSFSEAVEVVGAPTLGIDMDPADGGRGDAVYASGSGTAELVFAHEVVQPNFSTRGIAVLADTLSLAGGTIRSVSTLADAELGHVGLGHDPDHRVDWRRLPSDASCNWAPVFAGTLERTNNAPPGYLVSLTLFRSDFTDPDGDPLTFEISTSRDDVVASGGITHVERFGRLFFVAKTACALLELDPEPGEVYETTVTTTATDPDGATASATRIFRTDPTWSNSTESLEDDCPQATGAQVDGATLVISLDGAVAISIEPPTPAEFAVTADGAAVSVASVRAPGRDDTTITLELEAPVTHGQTVTVTYAPGDYAIAAAFADQPATNNTPENRAPVFGGTAELTNTAPPGFLVSLTLWQSDFTDPDGDPLTFEISTSRDDVVAPDGISHNERLGRLFFVAKTACALLELDPDPGEVYETTVTMTATDPHGATASATRIFRTDPTWNTSTASLEDVCPEVAGAAVDNATLVVSLDGAVAMSVEPPTPAEFTVTADGAAVAVASVRRPVRDDATITLELAAPVTAGQAVTVSYAPGDYPIAFSFANHSVTNNTPKPPVPVCVTAPEGATAPICAAVSGNDLIVTFSGNLAPINAATASALRFSFFVDGAYHNGALIKNQSAGRVSVDGAALTLTLGTAVQAGDVVTIHYSASSAGNGLNAADGTALSDFTLTVTTTAQS